MSAGSSDLATSERGSIVRAPDGGFLIAAIGASAGGLEAATKLLDALPPDTRMAFILVQHLDPDHASLMTELLSKHTGLSVREATDGVIIEREHLYIIPPGKYLSVGDGALHLSVPSARRGARRPFDHLLQSMAESCGPRTVCVVLSGTGADGSEGIKAVALRSGYAFAQDPADAEYAGMPESAIATGSIDEVLPVADIAAALIIRARDNTPARDPVAKPVPDTPPKSQESLEAAPDCLPEILELLRTDSSHDFTNYKPGTLRRRIERRMAMVAIRANEMTKYLEALRADPNELAQLAKDLLIHVTGFFRDPETFRLLSETIVPELDHEGRSGPNPGVDRRMQHGRGGLLARHAVSRGHVCRGRQGWPPETADLRIRRRRRRGPGGPRRPVSGSHPIRGVTRAADKVLHAWRNEVIGSRPSCARPWSSPCRTCSSTLRFPVWTWCRAAT